MLISNQRLRTLGCAIMFPLLWGCTNGNPITPPPAAPSTGLAILCETGPGDLQASLVLHNLDTGVEAQEFIAPNSTASGVCAAVNEAAIRLKLPTDDSGGSPTGFNIYYANPSALTIDIEPELALIDTQPFFAKKK